jgi:hypothetical protein
VVLVLLGRSMCRVEQEADGQGVEQQDGDVPCMLETGIMSAVAHMHDVEGVPDSCKGRLTHNRHSRHMQGISTVTCRGLHTESALICRCHSVHSKMQPTPAADG